MNLKTACFCATLALLACNKENDRPAAQADGTPVVDPKPVTASGQTASASSSIAEARCAREQRCENVGDNKKFSSSGDCMDRIRADWKDDLNARECPNGVKRLELDECLSAIRAEDCGAPLDTLARVTECTAGQICDG